MWEILDFMPKTPTKKTPMSDAHKAALAQGCEEGRVVRRYLEALESSKPKRGRKRTADSIQKRLAAIEDRLLDADQLTRLNLIEERRRLEEVLSKADDTTYLAALEKDFVKVARSYGERKGITYSSWRAVGVSAATLQQAKIARTRG